ncbi:hypothetical protein J6590_003468 [Homalodisca vitripennis]|nr:hypothetical protein J6590_003468 [Homalodisca vitripennis]
MNAVFFIYLAVNKRNCRFWDKKFSDVSVNPAPTTKKNRLNGMIGVHKLQVNSRLQVGAYTVPVRFAIRLPPISRVEPGRVERAMGLQRQVNHGEAGACEQDGIEMHSNAPVELTHSWRPINKE